jgi:hypothetical protein
MVNLYEIILMADIYGSKPVLKVGRLESFKTRFGTLLTFISILSMFSAFIYFSLDLFSNNNPKLVLSIRNIFNPPKYHLSNENYGFAFGLQDINTYNQFIDEAIYQARAFQKTATRVPIGNTTEFQWDVMPLEISRCSLDKFPEVFHDLFQFSPLSDMYCLKNNSFDIDGTFLNDHYSFLYIELHECRNTTDNINNPCKPKEVIDEVLAGAFFAFSHTDITIDPTNFTNPNQNYNGDSYTTISNKYFKEMHHFVKQITIETDRGFLLTDTSSKVFLKDDYIKEMIDFRESTNFLSYTFKLSTLVETYGRSYKKIQNVAAEVGGIIELISVLSIILSYFYNKAKFNELIINELFFTEEKKTHHLSNKVFKSTDEITKQYNTRGHNQLSSSSNARAFKDSTNKPTIVTYSKPTILTRNTPNDILKPKDTVIVSPTIRLNFCQGFFYFLTPWCFRKDKFAKVLDKGQQLIETQLDILRILKKFNEVDRMKEIIFDENQLRIFNLPFKTKLNIDNDESPRKMTKDEILKYFNVIKDNNSNKMNAAIIKSFDQNINRLLNEIPV